MCEHLLEVCAKYFIHVELGKFDENSGPIEMETENGVFLHHKNHHGQWRENTVVWGKRKFHRAAFVEMPDRQHLCKSLPLALHIAWNSNNF